MRLRGMSRGIERWLWAMRGWLWLESRIGFEIPLFCFVLYVALKGDSLRVPHTSSFPAVVSHNASSRGLCPRDGRRRPSLHLRLASPARDSRCGCRYAFFTARVLSDRSVIKLVTSGTWRAERHCFRSQKWSGELRIEPSGVSKWDRDADFAGGI